jgi:hypothetical protein
MAGIKSESVAGFFPESVADFLRNQQSGLSTALPRAQLRIEPEVAGRRPGELTAIR